MTASTVKVKPLEWRQVDDDDFEAVEYDCHAVSNGKGWGLAPRGWPCLGDHPYRTLEAAKAAAQADYEAYILSAINTTDLDAHIAAALAEAADEIEAILKLDAKAAEPSDVAADRWEYAQDLPATILALRPTALTALDRAKREARVEGMRAAMQAASLYNVNRGAGSATARAIVARISALIEKEGEP